MLERHARRGLIPPTGGPGCETGAARHHPGGPAVRLAGAPESGGLRMRRNFCFRKTVMSVFVVACSATSAAHIGLKASVFNGLRFSRLGSARSRP